MVYLGREGFVRPRGESVAVMCQPSKSLVTCCVVLDLETAIARYTQITTVASALEGCAVGMSGRHEDDQTAEAALREMESSRASLAARCLEMLKALE